MQPHPEVLQDSFTWQKNEIKMYKLSRNSVLKYMFRFIFNAGKDALSLLKPVTITERRNISSALNISTT